MLFIRKQLLKFKGKGLFNISRLLVIFNRITDIFEKWFKLGTSILKSLEVEQRKIRLREEIDLMNI